LTRGPGHGSWPLCMHVKVILLLLPGTESVAFSSSSSSPAPPPLFLLLLLRLARLLAPLPMPRARGTCCVQFRAGQWHTCLLHPTFPACNQGESTSETYVCAACQKSWCVHLSNAMWSLSLCPSLRLSVSLAVRLSVALPLCLSVSLSPCRPVSLSLCLAVSLSLHLLVRVCASKTTHT
jgi:hypothetical protein